MMENILVFKTDIKQDVRYKGLELTLNDNPLIDSWFVDNEDVDNVLKVITVNDVTEKDIIKLVTDNGYYCEGLPD